RRVMTVFDSEPELGELDPSEERRLSELLESAYAPAEIDPARHERLLLAALEDPFAPASAEELVESERLREALAGHGGHEDLALARALASAFAPGTGAPSAVPMLELAPTGAPKRAPKRREGNVILLRLAGGGAALAAAAAVLLAILPSPGPESTPDLRAFTLAQSRSTAPLFEPDSAGAASSRIDRIASLRRRDLRDNRYALWGVR
ncbi:MAG: hypothetical protein ABIQ16_09865, partial [Polyangiaceae bacterium]